MAEGNANENGSTDPNEHRNFTSTIPQPTSTNPRLGPLSFKSGLNSAHVEGKRKITKKPPTTKEIYHKQSNLPFTVCHWNCASGLTNKLEDIKLAISELKPTVIFITEADRKLSHDDKLIQIRGYALHNCTSRDKYNKSRIIAYTKDDSNLTRRLDLESPDDEVIIFDKIFPNAKNVDRVIGLYRPFTGPDGDKSSGGTWKRFEHLVGTVNKALEDCDRATIVGDFNVDLLMADEIQSRYTKSLKAMCDTYSLEQLINEPTRIQTLKVSNEWKVQESLLDHVYSSDFRSVKQCGCLHLSQSDHLAIYIQYANLEHKSSEKKVVYRRDHRLYSKQEMSFVCSNEDWSTVFNETDIQKCYNTVEQKLQEVINTVAPLRKVIISEKHPISNHTLRSLENRRRTLYKKMKRAKSEKSIRDYKLIKLKIKTKVKTLRKTEITKLLKNRNMRNLWQGVNTICGRNSVHTEKFSLSDPHNGKTTTDNRACAGIFAHAFKNKVDNLIQQVGIKDPLTDQITQKFPISGEAGPQFEINDIVEVINQMKKSSSSGPDDISITYIKDAALQLAPVLKFVFDKVSLFARMPVQWKLAKIVPLHKKGPKENPENFRPISQLCSLGKIFEKCLLNVMNKKFEQSLPSPFQHGFRTNHSTCTAALTVQNYVAKALDRKKKVVVVSTDMSAAFDLLDKEVLLPRMMKLGIPQSLCNIYEDFLSDRRAYVQCGQARSEEFTIPVGCVQGSPSGPYLFTILVDGISEHMSDVNLVAYADDMYFIYEGNTWDEVTSKASLNTKKAIDWLKKSGMVINASKTEAAYFASRELRDPPKIKIDDVLIQAKKCLSVLGIIFDHKMSWEPHIEKLLKEANSRTQALRHMHEHLTKSERLNVAHGLFFGKFYYCSSVWLTELLSKHLLHRLTAASNSCLRAVLGYRVREISTINLHAEADILTPYQRGFYEKAVMFWKIIHSCVPAELHLDLLNQGAHNKRNATFYLHQNNLEAVGKFAFANRLNNIVSILGDRFLDESEFMMKKTVKRTVLEKIPAKCS